MNKEQKNEKGFTMIELIIVIAVMGVIGAVLVPAFGTISAKSKISTDISTAQTIKRLIEAYNTEVNIADAITNECDKNKIGEKLYKAGYLESSQILLQTEGNLIYNPATTNTLSKLKIDLREISDKNIKDAASKMLASNKTRYENWLEISQ